ncbi:N-acetyltransferase [Shewanella sp. KX20019]|uniref:GNAT family N-acetyltransferase n=1 Tax=Shewanella sp. KX20019 TaxID=2803864 RepID=UPI001928B0BD|nr:N-acetyltransferase [Shewanella sp. KX20019]QQX80577.1 N-acetyltransferase [Shewanella sp. KX20019]
MSINIRLEKPCDITTIHQVTAAAFLDAPHTDHTEQFIVDALRHSGALSVSIVAEDSSKIVGHVALSPVTISNGTTDWYGLGPISVNPTEQGRGIGSKLMHAALRELKNLNANGCVLLGDPKFYRQFGFEPLDGLVLADVPAEYFQAVLLQGARPAGAVTYHESFLAKG